MLKNYRRPLAVALLAALTACSTGGNNAQNSVIPSAASSGLVRQNFVGIGDSLTFGWQSSGGLGALTTSPVSALPGNVVPAGQTMGFWALMDAQMNGITLDPANMNLDTALGAGSSPLPLIKGPGLGDELVVTAAAPGFTASHSPCDAFNQLAYSSTTWRQTRVNPFGPIADLGVPGITMHEGVTMTHPITGAPNGTTCAYASLPGDPTSGNLQSLVQGESQAFYPVLGQFQSTMPQGFTQLSAAVSLHPKLVTVWLGANDVLKYIFSHGQSPATDSPAQFTTDITKIITTLEASGAKVVVGNLPDILGNPGTNEPPVPQFFPQGKISADLQALTGAPSGETDAAASYVQAHYTQGSGGFLTESGFFSVLSQFAGGSVTPNLDPSGAGSGDGALYLDQTFAAQAIALNAGYNQIIDQVAAGTGAALADIQTNFQALASSGFPIGPGETLTLQFGGGLLSFDGAHPSDAGYALIANIFIGAADTSFNSGIPLLSNAQIGAIVQNDPYDPYVIKAINPSWPYPLP